jgi:hypothetical protein
MKDYGTVEKPIVVGCIDVLPGSEKLAFLSNFTSTGADKDSYDRRGTGLYWRKHTLRDIVLCDQPRNVDVFDSQDALFFLDNDLSEQSLEVLVSDGVPEMTALDCEVTCVSPAARPDHFIIAVSGRALYSGISYWCSFLFSADPSKEERDLIMEVAELYNYVNDRLTQCGSVIVLVTHVDTISHHDLDEAQEIIQTQLGNCNVPRENIVFGRRGCTWNETDIMEHENGIINAFLECKMFGGPYIDHLPHGEYSSTVLPLSNCNKLGCQHQFTEKSSQDLRVLLDRVTKIELCSAK